MQLWKQSCTIKAKIKKNEICRRRLQNWRISSVPKLTKGNQPTDDGNFILSEEEADKLIREDPNMKQCVRRYIGAQDYINNNQKRYCLWLKNIDKEVYADNQEIQRRLENIKSFRLKSSAEPTRKSAEKAFQFFSTPQTDETYMIIPRVSSQRRYYIPAGFMNADTIAADSCSIVCGASIYHFGVIISIVHMAWMRVVAGRLKSDYRYSGGVVYNNFVWPTPSDEQKAVIEQTALGILDARGLYPDKSLAELYDPDKMPTELMAAHEANDKAVMGAYGFSYDMTEPEIVAELMKMYQKLVATLKVDTRGRKSGKYYEKLMEKVEI